MSKITDHDYRLPVIYAMADMGELGNGRTKPRLVEGMDIDSSERGSYVVKFAGGTQMTTQSCCNELLGAWIAKELELPVAEPVLVQIDDPFIETLRGDSCYDVASKSKGLNFGSHYEPTFNTHISNLQITSGNQADAMGILCFDALIANGDRRKDKANLLLNQDGLLMIDHELAFSFLMILPFLRNKTPWIFQDMDKTLIRDHLFYSYYRNRGHDFTSVVEKYACLDDIFFNRAKSLMPEPWVSDSFEEIVTYIHGITVNGTTFANEFNAVINS